MPGTSGGGAAFRVLIISPYGVGTHYSGPAILHSRLAEALQRAGHDVAILTGGPVDDGFDVHCSFSASRWSIANQILWFIRTYLWLLMHARDYDVLHIVGGYAFNLSALALPRAIIGVRTRSLFVASEGGDLSSAISSDRSQIRARLQRLLLTRIDVGLALSEGIARELSQLGVKIVHRMRNPVDLTHYRPPSREERVLARRRLGFTANEEVVSCCGVLGLRKGQHILLEAVKQLRQRGRDVQAVLAGPIGEDWPAPDAGEAEYAHMLGHVQDVRQVYWASDVFALLSAQEGFPAALVEALACGLPAVVTPAGGMADLTHELITHTPRSVEAVAAALGRSLSMHRKSARPVFVHQFSIDQVVAEYVLAIQELQNGIGGG